MKFNKIIESKKIFLAGLSFFGDPFKNASEWSDENEIGLLWKRFVKLISSPQIDKLIFKAPKICYEVWSETDETEEKATYAIFIGTAVDSLDKMPFELTGKVLPETDYAVFTLGGSEITSDWAYEIYTKKLPELGYKPTYKYNFQYYDERFKGLDKLEESTLDIYIPVAKVNG